MIRIGVRLLQASVFVLLLGSADGELLAQSKKSGTGPSGNASPPTPSESEDEPDLTVGGSPFELEGTDPIDAGPPPEEMAEGPVDAAEGDESVLPNEASLRADDPEVPDSNATVADDEVQPFRIGPSLALGLPQPLAWSLEMMFGNSWSGAFSLGSNNAKREGVSFSISSWDVRARWHPFEGSFFFGTSFGSQKVKGETDQAVDGVDTKFIVTATNRYVTPHVGWFSVWPGGLTLGFEAGWQVAMNPDSDFDARFETGTDQQEALKASETYKKEKKDIEDAAETLTGKGLPYLKVLRVGWLF